MLEMLTSERFCDQAPPQVYAPLLDEGVYLLFVRTMYRILAADGASQGAARPGARTRTYRNPNCWPRDPNEVWSWDITKLLGPAKWTYFYLYGAT